MAKVNVKIVVINVIANSVKVFDSAPEALAAFEAAKGGVAMLVISVDMDKKVCEELGLVRKLGAWPWFQKAGEEGLSFYEGREQWYWAKPMVWTMKRGDISSRLWRDGFVALMRAAW